MELVDAIQKALECLKNSVGSEDDLVFDESNFETTNGSDTIHAQLDDAEQEVLSLNESLSSMEESRNNKMKTISEKKSQFDAASSKLKDIKEETEKFSEKIKKYHVRKVEALAEFSQKDIETLSETKMKLRAYCALTGVYFKPSKESVSDGYVANNATGQVKLFDVGGLRRKAATEKLWESIEKTTARLD